MKRITTSRGKSAICKIASILITLAIGFMLGNHYNTGSNTDPKTAGVTVSSHPAMPSTAARKSRILTARATWEQTLSHLLFTPQDEVVHVAEGLRELFLLSGPDQSNAWRSLSQRSPRNDYVGSMIAAYLWSRQAAVDSKTPLPEGWGLENFPGLVEMFQSRDDLDWIRSALTRGEAVSSQERRLFFLEAVRTDPVGCFKLWIKDFDGESHLDEIQWFHQLLDDPSQRSALLGSLSCSSISQEEKAELLGKLLASWCGRNPSAAKAWLDDPAVAPYREKLLIAYADQQIRTNPQNAWNLSEALAPDHRLSAQISAAGILARDTPEMGIEKLAELPPGEHRQKLMTSFGESLAMFHYSRWLDWRNDLHPAEQDMVNQAAFESWLNAEPSAALGWMEKLPNGPMKASLMSEFASQFASEETAAVAAWIRTLPDPDDRLTAVVSGIRGIPSEQHQKIRMMLEALP